MTFADPHTTTHLRNKIGSLSVTVNVDTSPVELFKRLRLGPFSMLLEGSPGGWFDGRFSLLAGAPFAIFQSKNGSNRFDHLSQNRTFFHVGDPLANLEKWISRFYSPVPPEEADIPLSQGGVAGFFSYDLVHQMEKIPPPLRQDPSLPDIFLMFLNQFALYDHAKQQLTMIYHSFPEIQMGEAPQEVERRGRRRLEELQRYLEDTTPSNDPDGPPCKIQGDLSAETYMQMVRRAKEYIAAGDIFQANLSHRFSASYAPPFGIYERLRQINPSPFSAYLKLGEIEISSGSPERLVRARGGRVETWPIAGTKPRGKNHAEDEQMIYALYESKKERAEHLMLVDLERNDLGRICRYGSVRVSALMDIEKYSHVIHLVSRIEGMLIQKAGPLHILSALFPGGTITGVPKIRCMEIISELEKRARGIYTGSIGYIGFDGEIDLNIAIRTWVRHGKELSFQVGAGIVADSDPESEYQETLQKAAALIKAVQT